MAVTIAVIGFFALAGVGWAGGLSAYRCALRGLIGAGVLYAIITVAGRLAVRIIVDAVVPRNYGGGSGDRQP